MVFSGNSFSATIFNYTDSACESSISDIQITSTFSIGDTVTLSDGNEAKEVDYTGITWTLVIRDSSMISSWNSNAVCDNTSWELNKPVNMTNCTQLALPTEIFDIFKIDDTRLFFGETETGEGTSDSSRPTQLEQEFFNKRVD